MVHVYGVLKDEGVLLILQDVFLVADLLMQGMLITLTHVAQEQENVQTVYQKDVLIVPVWSVMNIQTEKEKSVIFVKQYVVIQDKTLPLLVLLQCVTPILRK